MSTYLYLECLDHTPSLCSDGEVGQHLYDLPRICAEVRDRAAFVAIAEHEPNYGSHFTNNAARFFRSHERCVIEIFDEYGRRYPLNDRGHGCHPVGPSTDVLRCHECEYLSTAEDFTTWEDHWSTHERNTA